MDINQYIGAFLLKNKYCSLPGLGVFDLKKTNARTNNSEGTVEPPTYLITFNPIGSIDDTFASYIASKENVSIANASNNIKTYCVDVKNEVAKTGKFEIDNLGRFTMQNNKLSFQQSSDLNLGFEPVPAAFTEIKVSTPKEEAKIDYSYTSTSGSTYKRKKSSQAWMKMLLPILGIVGLGIAGYLGYAYYQNHKDDVVQEVTPVEKPIEIAPTDTSATQSAIIDTTVKDTSSMRPTADTSSAITTPAATNVTPPPAPTGKEFRVAVFSTSNQEAAKAKAAKWTRFGNKANVIPSGSEFIVTIDASQPMNDTTLLVDSLRRFFNPKGNVYILK